MKYIDSILNEITMYKLTLYYLIFLVGAAVALSFFGILSYNPLDILINAFLAVIVCYVANFVFAKMVGAVTNSESVFITALILVLIIPVKFPTNIALIIGASVLAMAAKYLLTVEKRHLFNPAAVSVAGISLLSPTASATWWIGTPAMLPFVLIGGLLLIRKIQRENMIFSFLIAYLLIIAIGTFIATSSIQTIISNWQLTVFHSALFFFMFVMLTEPLTSPVTEKLRNYYAYFTAFLYATPALNIINISFTPEIALIFGNVFSYIINPNYRLALSLKHKLQLSPDTFEFAFNKQNDFHFLPGQYLEWTLQHKNVDNRGNRRYFSISSSPTENQLTMTVKFYNPSSSYKKELLNFENGKQIIAAQVAGDFVLPKNLKQPLVFIAGGVGIAPFRSMIQYIVDKGLLVDIILLYTNKTVNDILYVGVFEKVRENGVKTIYNLTDLQNLPHRWGGTTGYITQDSIKQVIPDYRNRKYYLSGPQLMVQNFEKTLRDAGVQNSKIKTDFFPGYNEK
jgi:ferredoxin-NADP reductase/Na+-translocating ferredoxin:NAD+ oxidoreductase RnfD subunit